MISKDLLKDVWSKIDDIVDWQKIAGNIAGSILEIADNVGGPMLLNAINEKAISKLPEEVHDNLERALQAWLDDDYEAVLAEIPETLDDLVDFKALSDETEDMLAMGLFRTAVEIVQFHSQKSSQPEAPGNPDD